MYGLLQAIAHLHMVSRLDIYAIAHLHMFSKLELSAIAHLHMLLKLELSAIAHLHMFSWRDLHTIDYLAHELLSQRCWSTATLVLTSLCTPMSMVLDTAMGGVEIKVPRLKFPADHVACHQLASSCVRQSAGPLRTESTSPSI